MRRKRQQEKKREQIKKDRMGVGNDAASQLKYAAKKNKLSIEPGMFSGNSRRRKRKLKHEL